MIWSVGKNRYFNKNIEIIEATNGNTEITLAYVATAKNYKLTFAMPDTISMERKKLLKSLGVNLVLTNRKYGMQGVISKTNETISYNPKKISFLKQFENPDNPEIHKKLLELKYGMILMVI